MTEDTVRSTEEAPEDAPPGADPEGASRSTPDAEPGGTAGPDAAARGADPTRGAGEAEEGRAVGALSPEMAEELAAEEDLGQAQDHLESELQEVQEELDGLHDRHLRLAAEFENYRRRVQTEMSETWIRAQADLVRRLLESVDDLQRVALLDPENATVEAIVEGVDLVERKVLRALEESGVEVVDPTGQTFDPESMEAMMRVPAESEEEDDVVDQVFQRGYTLKGHLVRPARVSVRKHG